MTELTPEQAKVLRDLRPQLRTIDECARCLYKLLGVIDSLCPHMERDDPDCPVCQLDEMLAELEVRNMGTGISGFMAALDGCLERGPYPRHGCSGAAEAPS